MRLQYKVAIITGAGRGIGQATAVKFAQEGARVVVCDLTPEWIEETVEMCKETRGDAFGFIADVRDIRSLENMVDVTLAKWGRVDCLVNNVGGTDIRKFEELTDDDWQASFELNLMSAVRATLWRSRRRGIAPSSNLSARASASST